MSIAGSSASAPRWGLFAASILTILVTPFWLALGWWFANAWTYWEWETICYRGAPAFALGQALLAVVGVATGIYGTVRTFRTFNASRHLTRGLWVWFGVAGTAFAMWLFVLARDPEPVIAPAWKCHAEGA